MSSINDLLQMLVAGNSRRIPLRDVYYRCCHKGVIKRLKSQAEKALPTSEFMERLVAITGITMTLDIDDQERNRIMADADKVVAGVFNMLGSGDVELNPIPWSKDFISGYEWKKGTYYRKYNQVDLSNNADVKVPRELSRCHHLLHLALAYRFTGKEQYAKLVVDHIINWIKENPLMYSINWCCSMDIGIRAVNWIWSLSLLNNYKISKDDIERIRGSLYQHGWFIYNNLEGNNYSYNNNHYFSDIVGLLHVAMLFGKGKEAAKWLRFATTTFYRETRLQVLPSGMSFEGSTNYHRLVLELVLTSAVLLHRNGKNVPPDIWGRLESMFDFVMRLTMPNGTMPIVGDQDNGRLLPWGVEDLNDHRYLLSVGAMLFNRGDLKHYSTGYNIYASIFGGSREVYESIVEDISTLGSQLLRDAGFVLMRKDDSYLLFNVDNQGMYCDTGTAMSHTHCDWLSLVLCANGVPFIIDPGSYVYSSDAKARNLFRSTRMHNTIVIDNENQEKMPEKQLWDNKRKTSPKVLDWQTDDNLDIIVCEHYGYKWLGDAITHRRKVEFDKKNSIWLITDLVVAGKNHNIAAYYHLDENVEATVEGRNVMLSSKGVVLNMAFESEEAVTICLEPSLVSKGYGECMDSQTVVVIANSTNNIQLVTKIWQRKD